MTTASTETASSRTPRDPVLWLVLALALAVRAWCLARYPYARGMGDESVHYAMGVLASRFGPSVLGHWSPGYDAMLGAIFRWLGPDPLAPKIAQVALSTATVGLVYGLARRAGGRRAARIAASLCAVHPSLVFYSLTLFSETLFVALLTASAWAWLRRGDARSTGDCVVAGILMGCAVLTRSVILYLLPFWIAWVALRGRRREAVQLALLLGVALAVVLPWTVRNALKYRALLPVDGTLGRTAYFAFRDAPFNQDLGFLHERSPLPPTRPPCRVRSAPGMDPLPAISELERLFPAGMHGLLEPGRSPHGPIAKAREFATVDLAERQRCEIGRALEFAGTHPATVFENVLRRFYGFWGPNSFLLRWIHAGAYPDGILSRAFYPSLKWLVVAFHVLVVGTALLALARRPVPAVAEWSALLGAYYTAIHVVAVACSRYRLPLEPFLIVTGSLWLARPSPPEGRARMMMVAAALVSFAVLCGHYVATRLP